MDWEYVDNEKILELHEVRDFDKLDRLIESMEAGGWTGRPILAIDFGAFGLQAATGSHRIAAARETGYNVPCFIVPEKKINEDFVREWGFANDDDDRLRVLKDFGFKEAAELMAEEVKHNEEEE
jgi:hypothetical protein